MQFGGDGDDTVRALAADEDVTNDIFIVGSTIAEEDVLFADLLDTPSEFGFDYHMIRSVLRVCVSVCVCV